MLDSFYAVASGMLQQQRTINVISNNIANVNTAGFKAERVVAGTFEQQFLTRLENGEYVSIGEGSPVRTIEQVVSMHGENLIKDTDRAYDFAISGEGYFTIVDDEEKTYLTRNGAFDIDDEGFLILPDRGRVQGMKGDIKLDKADFVVTTEGLIIDGKGKVVDRLLIQKPAVIDQENAETQDQDFVKYENGMYAVGNAELLEEINPPNIYNYALEGSNIDINREYAMMMESQRNFQACSSALKMVDAINAKTSDIGRV